MGTVTQAVQTASHAELRKAAPGAYMYTSSATHKITGMFLKCPGCGGLIYLPWAKPHNPRWEWNGDWRHPTLHPAIDHTPTGCSFQGWLRDGKLVIGR